MFQPINFPKWVEENKPLLQPPVNNKCVFSGEDFFVMAIGGPNNRTDYHINQTEEWFYQVQGNMVLKIVDESTTPHTFRDIPILEGEMFLLPARVPHSPQRVADTLGLVIERTRVGSNAVDDALRWYCDSPECRAVVYEEKFLCVDVVTQLKAIINTFNSGDKKCQTCGNVCA
jgi:3-hydroxyanthranilate 3,4-dioxygenase